MNSAEVEGFLRRWRTAAVRWIDFVPRTRNLEGMRQLGLTKTQVVEELRSLRVEDYSLGPEIDRETGRRDLFVFGRRIGGMQVYIKVKLFEAGGIERAKCLSFHPAEHEMRHPFAGGSR